MTALGHSFRTEIESKSFGNPSFLSRHLDAMCPPTQEEDEWLEQELERARQQRGSFYRKLASSRATSVRDLDDLNGSRQFSASRGSTERDLSGSPTGSNASPPPPIPEPHSSWRFYTSYDNGEWKRHCVPDKKTEEDILIKSPSSEKEKEVSPAYESHLKKYKQARASLFDRPARRFAASNSPQGETTTVRVVSHGNPGGLRSALGGSTNKLPFGGSTPDIRFRTIREPEMSNATSLPSQYREETTTSETITSVHGAEIDQPKPKEQQPIVVKASARPRHHNLGFKEKIIIPTKYKTGSESSAKASERETVSMTRSAMKLESKPVERKSMEGARRPDEPSFLGSTFEKFSCDGKSLVKPTFPEENSGSKRKPVFGDPFSTSSSNHAKRRSVVGSPTHQMTSTEIKMSTGSGEIPHTGWPSYLSSTPVNGETVKYSSSTERRSLPFGSPVERSIPVRNVPALEKPIPQFEKSSSIIQPPEENKITLGTENSAFSVPNRNRLPPASSEPAEPLNGERVMYSRVHSNVVKSHDTPKTDGVVFIPVIRVRAPSQDGCKNHEEEGAIHNQWGGKHTDRLTGFPILDLLEDSGGGEERVYGFGDSPDVVAHDVEQRNSPGAQSDVSGSEQLDSNNNRRVRNSPLRDITNRNGSHDTENQNRNDVNERVLYPTSTKVKPVFTSSNTLSQGGQPFATSSLQNLSSKSEERISKAEDRLPKGERIIIPSKYRQTSNDNVAPGSNGFLSENRSRSTVDVSSSQPIGHRMSSNDGSTFLSNQELVRSKTTRNESPQGIITSENHPSISPTSSTTKRKKPVFPDFGWGGSVEALPRMSKPFNEAEVENIYSNVKEGNDSGVSVNPDNSHADSSDGLQLNQQQESCISPESMRNDSRDGDSGIWRDPGVHSLRKDNAGGDGWVIERAVRF